MVSSYATVRQVADNAGLCGIVLCKALISTSASPGVADKIAVTQNEKSSTFAKGGVLFGVLCEFHTATMPFGMLQRSSTGTSVSARSGATTETLRFQKGDSWSLCTSS